MKKHYIFLILTVIAIPFLFAASNGVAEVQDADRTGAPGSANACSQCHGGGDFGTTTGIVVLESGLPVTEYVPGTTYTINFLVGGTTSQAAEHGFQGTVVLEDGSNAGTFQNPGSNVQLEDVDGRHIVEHNSPSMLGLFTTEWIAPEIGSGEVTFYASGNAVDGTNSTSGDEYAGATFVLTESVSSIEDAVEESLVIYQTGGNMMIESVENSILSVYDLSGRTVFTSRLMNGLNTIPVSDLQQGVLIFNVQNNGVAQVEKVFVR